MMRRDTVPDRVHDLLTVPLALSQSTLQSSELLLTVMRDLLDKERQAR